MGQYAPQRILNRRRRLVEQGNPNVTTMLILSVFLIMLSFFIIFVALSTPNAVKSQGLMDTLESRFRPVSGDNAALTATSPIPDWLASGEGAAPLATLRDTFPDAFVESDDAWGGLRLRFTPDRFQAFVLDNAGLAKSLFAGLTEPLANDDDYMVEVTIGTEGRSPYEANALRQKAVRTLQGFGIDPSRAFFGYEPDNADINLRMTTAAHYRGAI